MDVKYHSYADDSQLLIHLSPGNCANSLHQLKACLNDIHTWIFENKLKLNPEKNRVYSLVLWISINGSRILNILGNCLFPTNVVCYLGVLLDSKFSFTNLVNSVIKSCFANLRDLHHIQRLLSYDVSVMLGNALVSSLRDYWNSLFCNLSPKNITRLQNIQNCLACFVSGTPRCFHVTTTLKSFLWLPVKQRIIFKTLVLVHK